MNTNTTRRINWLIAAALLSVGGAVLWPTGRDARAADARKPPDAPPVQVTTAPVAVQDVPVYRSGIGTVAPTMSVTVKARVDGQLDKVGFAEGQDVRKGQVLALLDPRTLQAQLQQVRAQRARDLASLANARADLQRYAALLAEDAATQQQVDTQKALVAQLEAAVSTDDAQVDFAQVQLGFATITAPIGGRVGARLVDPGNIVRAADATGLVVINQIDPISVVFTLPESAVQDIDRASSGGPLSVQALSRDGTALLGAGTLTVLNNQIDTATGTVELKASFPNPRHALWPGQYVNARLLLGTRRHALTIPAAAVQRSEGGVYAYVVEADGKTVRNTPVSVAAVQDGVAVIERGLAAGQRVVVDGQYKIRPGVRVAEAARDASAPTGAALALADAAAAR